MKITITIETAGGNSTTRTVETNEMHDNTTHDGYNAAALGHELVDKVARILGNPDKIPADVSGPYWTKTDERPSTTAASRVRGLTS